MEETDLSDLKIIDELLMLLLDINRPDRCRELESRYWITGVAIKASS